MPINTATNENDVYFWVLYRSLNWDEFYDYFLWGYIFN